MLKFVVRRLLTLPLLLLLLTFIVFLMAQVNQADPARIILGDDASAASVTALRDKLGLNDPLFVRYWDYLGNLVHGDLGRSYLTDEPVIDQIHRTLPITLSLVIYAMVIAVMVSLVLGTLAALRRRTIVDRAVTMVSVVLIAAPGFVIGAILIKYLALGDRPFFPVGGYTPLADGFGPWLLTATLPALTIASIPLGELTRMARGSLIDAMDEDYIRTARAKGLNRVRVVGKHGAKNAAVPYVTILGLQTGQMIGSTVIVESIFNTRGFGQLGVASVVRQDLPVLQGMVLVSGVIMILLSLLVDVSYGYFNPRTVTQ